MKYILSLFIALWSIAAWGQEGGDGFNPSNPGEPGQRYNLTVNVTPRRGRQYLTFWEAAIRFGRICLSQRQCQQLLPVCRLDTGRRYNFPQPLFQLYHAGKEYGHNRCVQSYR